MNRKTKLILASVVCAALLTGVICLIVAIAKGAKPQPAPTETVKPVVTVTPAATPKPTPTPKPTEAGIPTLPQSTPAATPTATPAISAPALPGSTPKPASIAKPTTTNKSSSSALAFDFGLPAVANVNAQIAVTTSAVNITNVNWQCSKAGSMSGSLTKDGGIVSFKTPGKYTLTAVASSASGKSVTVKQDIEIFEVGAFAFGLPKVAYTDTVVDVDVLEGASNVSWSVQKDGASLSIADAFSGSLADTGG